VRPYKAPISLAGKNKLYRYYIRKGSVTVAAKDRDEKELLEMAATIPFDDRINHSARIEALDLGLIREYLKQVGSGLFEDAGRMDFLRLCRLMNLVDGPNEHVRPKNVGLMFFNPDPQKYFPQTQIDIVHFPEGLDADVFTEKIFKGPVHIMLRDALAHLESQVVQEKIRKFAKGPLADRVYNYSFPALKEAVCNAVYHRSFETREPVEIRVLPDRITINSFPGPDRSIATKDIKTFKLVSRRYRNRRVGEFLKELEMTEGRGTGIPKMLKALKRNGSPLPIFHTDKDRSFLMIEFPIHPSFLEESVTLSSERGSQTSSQRGSQTSSQRIVATMKSNSAITIGELARDLQISPRAIKKHIKSLREQGIIKRIGPDYGGHWEVSSGV
jgi:ATP-dependent DNA helicase RecG